MAEKKMCETEEVMEERLQRDRSKEGKEQRESCRVDSREAVRMAKNRSKRKKTGRQRGGWTDLE